MKTISLVFRPVDWWLIGEFVRKYTQMRLLVVHPSISRDVPEQIQIAHVPIPPKTLPFHLSPRRVTQMHSRSDWKPEKSASPKDTPVHFPWCCPKPFPCTPVTFQNNLDCTCLWELNPSLRGAYGPIVHPQPTVWPWCQVHRTDVHRKLKLFSFSWVQSFCWRYLKSASG